MSDDFQLVQIDAPKKLTLKAPGRINWKPLAKPTLRVLSLGAGVIGVYGGHARDRRRTITVTGSTPQQNTVRNEIRETFSIKAAQTAMDIDWMPMVSLS